MIWLLGYLDSLTIVGWVSRLIDHLFSWLVHCKSVQTHASTRAIEFDWVRLPNVRLTTPGSNEKASKPNIFYV